MGKNSAGHPVSSSVEEAKYLEVPQKYENICCSLELFSLIPLTNKTQKKSFLEVIASDY